LTKKKNKQCNCIYNDTIKRLDKRIDTIHYKLKTLEAKLNSIERQLNRIEQWISQIYKRLTTIELRTEVLVSRQRKPSIIYKIKKILKKSLNKSFLFMITCITLKRFCRQEGSDLDDLMVD